MVLAALLRLQEVLDVAHEAFLLGNLLLIIVLPHKRSLLAGYNVDVFPMGC